MIHVRAEQFLAAEAVPLRRELRAAAEDALDAGLGDARPVFDQPHGERFQQLGRHERALDVVPGAENGDRLIDDVVFVFLGFLDFAFLEQLDDPPRIEIDAEADPAAILGQVLDGQPQPARARRAPT